MHTKPHSVNDTYTVSAKFTLEELTSSGSRHEEHVSNLHYRYTLCYQYSGTCLIESL